MTAREWDGVGSPAEPPRLPLSLQGSMIDRLVFPERVQATLSWLFDEVDRLRRLLHETNARRRALEDERQELLQENRRLRREATLVRLYEDLGSRNSTGDGVQAPPSTAATLYRSLPTPCTFADFFGRAEANGVDTSTARECLRYFLRTKMLAATGSQLEKPSSVREARRTEDADFTVLPSALPRVRAHGERTPSGPRLDAERELG